MKKLVCLGFLSVILVTAAQAQGFLKAADKKIVTEKGENILLRGIGLGGWMLQEGYMLKLQGTNPQYSIRKRIEQLLSPAQTGEFYDTWLQNFVTRADIDSMRAWGFNSVRLPMHYNLYTLPVEQEPDSSKQTWLTKGFQLTDSLLSWCKANKIYLILDLHAAPGGQGNDLNIADRDSSKPALWQSGANKAKTIALWKKLAERYKDEPYIGGYDLLNETNWGFEDPSDLHGIKETGNKPLRSLLMDITQAIRSVDKKHLIIIEGNAWGNNYKGVFPLWDDNTAISFHKYWNSNNLQSIRNMLDIREQTQAPIWLGETGENSNTWFSEAVRLFEENNIGWSWWPLKKIGHNNPLEIKSNLNYNSLADYWNGRTKNPPKESNVYSGLLELAVYTNIRSNQVHKDVIDALFRQPFSTGTIPYKPGLVGLRDSIIHAVDYDLGRNGSAYFDQDTANYSGSGGRRGVGNRGNVYRNDGVDIFRDSARYESYYIGSTEAGEWLQYTITAKETAGFAFKLSVAAGTDSANVTMSVDGKWVFNNVPVHSTGSLKSWQTQPIGHLPMKKGVHVIRLYVNKGGFNLKELIITPATLQK
ncbi:MAG: cellulase family glycosylhydrolase [Williamsia sp.]|nr:cellulase family glycosylhydrolase [Williamsia sp.]